MNPDDAVSTAPADVVRRQYLASATGDMTMWRSAVAEDIESTESAGFPLAGTYRTPDAVIADIFEPLAATWNDWTTHDDDAYIVDGEHVVVLARYSAGNKATGKSMQARVAHSLTVRNGKIVRFEQIVDSATVRAAMMP